MSEPRRHCGGPVVIPDGHPLAAVMDEVLRLYDAKPAAPAEPAGDEPPTEPRCICIARFYGERHEPGCPERPR